MVLDTQGSGLPSSPPECQSKLFTEIKKHDVDSLSRKFP